jgi:ATP-dependent Clp protease ATP-binding subunit ClpC
MSDRRGLLLADELEPAAARVEPEILGLRKRARLLARDRKERPSTVHLLAAVAGTPGPARELLMARKLDEARLLSAARASEESMGDPLGEALAAARELARRRIALATGTQSLTASSIHVLLAILSNRRFAAQRVLEQCGVDVARLRAAATRIAYGVVHPPRATQRGEDSSLVPQPSVTPTLRPAARRNGKAVEVAWIPSKGLGSATSRTPVSSKVAPVDEASELGNAGVAFDSSSPTPSAVEALVPIAPSGGGPSGRPFVSFDDGLDLDPSAFPLLSRLGRNLSAAAMRGELEPVIGRALEVERALDVLAKRHANNPLLVGAPGVGKTSVARGLAKRLAEEPRSERLLIELQVGELLSGTGSRGSLAERIADLRAELVRSEGRVVLFIDEVHELFGGAADEAMGELKAALAAGQFPLVGATSPEQQRKAIDGDPALSRRFSVVEVEPPTESEAKELLESVCERLAVHHHVRYQPEAIAQAISWSVRYIPGRALPDKALAILDLAGARASRRSRAVEVQVQSARRRYLDVDARAVAEVVSETAAVPLERLLESDGERMLKLETLMGERVVGHRAACGRIAAVLRRNAAGLRGKRPIGSFLLLGPTGVGKTETAKAIAELLFHSQDAMTRLDMSEYAEAHAVARLVGAPPGYVGHEAGGILTEAVRKRPYQVLLLDEIEKAHRDVLESFLQVFDEGRLTDGRGRTADFTNTVIVLTSNLGAEEMRSVQTERRVGFAGSAPRADGDRLAEVALKAARAAMPPELYNRLDEVLFFAPLGRDEVALIARKLLAQLGGSLAMRGVTLHYEETVIDALMAAGGFEPELGARPMRRAVARSVEAPLADRILAGDFPPGSTAMLRVGPDGVLVIESSVGPARARR